jgi:hypothetical protein
LVTFNPIMENEPSEEKIIETELSPDGE